MTFEGKFIRERFKRGEIHFIDGDVLKGQWGNLKGRWILKKGVLLENGDKKVFEFTKEKRTFRSKMKEIIPDDNENGFCIKYDYLYINDKTPL